MKIELSEGKPVELWCLDKGDVFSTKACNYLSYSDLPVYMKIESIDKEHTNCCTVNAVDFEGRLHTFKDKERVFPLHAKLIIER